METFKTVRFGTLEYNREDVIELPDGLVGMPKLRKWLLLDMDEDVPIKWFQSLDRGDFGFPVMQPHFFHDNYEVDVPRVAKMRMRTQDDENLMSLIITTVHPGGTMMTGNLVAPLVLDSESRCGVQLTLDDAEFEIRQEIDYFKFGLAVKSDSSDNVTSTVDDRDASVASDELERVGI